MNSSLRNRVLQGFTIIELIVVIAVIGILAAIATVGYGAWQRSIAETTVKNDLLNAISSLENARTFANGYPADVNTIFDASDSVIIVGGSTDGGVTYCITATHQDFSTSSFFVTDQTASGDPQAGECPMVWSQVAVGSNHACGIASGTAYCWGSGANRRLGNASISTISNSPVPVPVDTSGVLAGRTVTAISAGASHTCAIADGLAFCWGDGTSGALGNGSTASNASLPVAVSTSGVLAGRTVTAISAGTSLTCAVADGLAFCWGSNTNGRLGDGSGLNSSVPVAVSTAGVLAGRTVTDIASGVNTGTSTHTCAVADSLAFCWGWGFNGQLGDSGTATQSTPVAVSTAGVLAGRSVSAVTTGSLHSCAIADSLAFCWGSGSSGILGQGSTSPSSVPVAVSTAGVLSGRTVSELTAGGTHTCAVADSLAFCWGAGAAGQLGRGTTSLSQVPIAVDVSGVLAGLSATRISAGNQFSCAVTNGSTSCWGLGTSGQLGDGLSTSTLLPVLIQEV